VTCDSCDQMTCPGAPTCQTCAVMATCDPTCGSGFTCGTCNQATCNTCQTCPGLYTCQTCAYQGQYSCDPSCQYTCAATCQTCAGQYTCDTCDPAQPGCV
jgi:hypothetical protein